MRECNAKHHKIACLHRVPIFQELNDEEIAALERLIITQHYRKKDWVFLEGENSENLYIVSKGLIKITKSSENGKEQILRLLFPGDYFGQFALFLDKTHYANAEVVADSDICLIHKRDLKLFMEQHPHITYKFMLTLSAKLQQADEWTGTITLMEIEQRLAKVLLLFHEKSESGERSFQLPIEKQDLAALIGTTPETLSRKLAQFESQNLLALDGRKKLRILDSDSLSLIAGELDR